MDEFQAHRFLESFGETLSVAAMRNALRDIDLDFNKKVSLIEYIVYKFKADVNIHGLVTASQGNKEEVDKATAMLEEAQRCLEKARAEAEESRKAEANAKSTEAEAKKAEKIAQDREAEAKR